MGEKKKLFFVILTGIAGIFFLSTNLFIPIYKDNSKRLNDYKKLNSEVKIIDSLGKTKLDSWERELDSAISVLEKKFIPLGKLKLTEQLTQVPEGSEIIFTDIAYRKPLEMEGYQVFPIDVSIEARFYDFIKYLLKIEENPLLIAVDNFNIKRVGAEDKFLDIRVTFVGFRLTHKSPLSSKYLEERYQPLDEPRLKNLIKPIYSRYDTSGALELKDNNPFTTPYDFIKREEKPKEAKSKSLTEEKDIGIEGLSLRGILSIEGKKAALINDVIAKEGDKISGMDVISIDNHKVILMREDKKYILKIGVDDEFIKP